MPLGSPTASGAYRVQGQTPSGRGFNPALYGTPGPVPGVNAPPVVISGARGTLASPTGMTPAASWNIRPYAAQAGGMKNLFDAWNAQGVTPPAGTQFGVDIGQWYQNGMWGGNTPLYLMSKGYSPGEVSGIINTKTTGADRTARDSASMFPNLTGGYGGPMQAGGMLPYGLGQPASGTMQPSRALPGSAMNWGQPQGQFTLPGMPTAPTAGFSTASDPWGLGMTNYARPK